MFKRLTWAGLLVASAACGETEPLAPEGDTILVRLVNASSSTTALDLMVNGEVVLAGVAAGQVSPFATIAADAPGLVVRRGMAGSMLLPLPAVAAADGILVVAVMGNNNVLYGSVSPVARADTGRAVAGRANFRAINLASTQNLPPEIDIFVVPPGVTPAGLAPAWQMNTFYALYTGLKDFPPGSLKVLVTLKGNDAVIAESAVLAVEADDIRVITLRHTGGTSFEVAVAAEHAPPG